jgi:hypothetical protein
MNLPTTEGNNVNTVIQGQPVDGWRTVYGEETFKTSIWENGDAQVWIIYSSTGEIIDHARAKMSSAELAAEWARGFAKMRYPGQI